MLLAKKKSPYATYVVSVPLGHGLFTFAGHLTEGMVVVVDKGGEAGGK